MSFPFRPIRTEFEGDPTVCIFCNQSARGGQKSSEHVLPQWLLEKLAIRRKGFRSITLDQITGLSTEHEQTFNTFVSKMVCANCNSGWMSDLEPAMALIVNKSFDHGIPLQVLSNDERDTVAAWMFKTSMAAIYARRMPLCPSTEHFRDFKNDLNLPDGYHVIGGNLGSESGGFDEAFHVKGIVRGITAPDQSLSETFEVGLLFGNILLVLIRVSSPDYVLAVDVNLQLPLGRPLSSYVWLKRRGSPEPKIFNDSFECVEDYCGKYFILPDRELSFAELENISRGYRFATIPDGFLGQQLQSVKPYVPPTGT